MNRTFLSTNDSLNSVQSLDIRLFIWPVTTDLGKPLEYTLPQAHWKLMIMLVDMNQLRNLLILDPQQHQEPSKPKSIGYDTENH